MTTNASQHQSRRRAAVVTGFAVFALALILFARVALDIALVLAMCAAVFLIERTAGDWVSDVLGARFGTLLFASLFAIFLWFALLTGGGQSIVERFLASADQHGFHTMFLERQIIPPSSVRRLPAPTDAQTSTPEPTETSAVVNPPRAETDRPAGTRDGTRTRGSSGTRPGTNVPTDVVLELTSTRAKIGERVVATATVRAAGEAVDGGAVMFTINGLSRAVAVKDGVATVDIVEMMSGRCEVRAQYRGTSRFAAASSAPAVLIIE